MDHQDIWRECPFVAVNALRTASGDKGARGHFRFGGVVWASGLPFVPIPPKGRPEAHTTPAPNAASSP